MAGVAGLRVVDVASDFLVLVVHPVLLVLVTEDAAELPCGCLVALDAVETGMRPASDREVVLEHGLVPRSVACQVAVLTARRKSALHVIRIPRRVVVRSVTAEAVAGQIEAARVARLAVERAVGALKRKELIVVERRPGPTVGLGPVAARAIGREPRLTMVGARRSVVVRAVAVDAARRRPREAAVHVARSAVRRPVLAAEREEAIVVEACSRPARGRLAVAARAVRRKSRLEMIGVRRALVVPPMAIVAVGGGSGEDAAGMARRAIDGLVLSAKREEPIVVELRAFPARRVLLMALQAVGGEARLLMIGVLGGLEVRPVAAETVGGSPGESPARMAGFAGGGLVRSGEREETVIELRTLPSNLVEMTELAVRGKTRGLMLRHPCGAEIVLMALDALRRRRAEAPGGVAVGTGKCGVAAPESEPGSFVVLPGPGQNPSPARCRMAVGALGAELEAVGIVLPTIPVAGFAGLGRSPENACDVAAPAVDELVLSREREARVVVSEEEPHPVR